MTSLPVFENSSALLGAGESADSTQTAVTGVSNVTGGLSANAASPLLRYVSTAGSDSNDGSASLPWLTLGKAKAEVATLIAAGLAKDVCVFLRGGTYRVAATESFGVDDSDATHTVTYRSYPGETAILSGASVPSGTWTQTPGKDYYQLDIPGQAKFRTLVVDGSLSTRARVPNEDSYYVMEAYSAGEITASPDDPVVKDYIKADSGVTLPTEISAAEGVEMITYDGIIVQRHIVDTITGQKIYSTVDSQPGYNEKGSYDRFWLENRLEFLTQAGEHYWDDTAERLYYWPRSGENMATAVVEIPQLEELVLLEGAEANLPTWSNDFTFSCWLRSNHESDGSTFEQWKLFGNQSLKTTSGAQVSLRAQNRPSAGGWNEGFVYVYYAGTSILALKTLSADTDPWLNDGNWHHVQVTIDRAAGQCVVEVDGTEAVYDGGQSINGSAVISSTGLRAGEGYEGEIDRLIVLDRAATAGDSTTLLAKGVPANVFNMPLAGNFNITCDTVLAVRHEDLYLDSGRNPVHSNPQFIDGGSDHNPCLQIAGDSSNDFLRFDGMPGQWIENIDFKYLHFTGGDWPDLTSLPDASQHFSGFGDDTEENISALLRLKYAKNVNFSDCEIYNCGSSAVLAEVFTELAFARCTLRDIGYQGINLVGTKHLVSQDLEGNSLVKDCTITRVGWMHINSRAIHVTSAPDVDVTGCLVYEVPHMGITYNGALNAMSLNDGGHSIKNNRVRDFAQHLSDCAGIYISGHQPNTVIELNRIKNGVHTAHHAFIRSDDDASGRAGRLPD